MDRRSSGVVEKYVPVQPRIQDAAEQSHSVSPDHGHESNAASSYGWNATRSDGPRPNSGSHPQANPAQASETNQSLWLSAVSDAVDPCAATAETGAFFAIAGPGHVPGSLSAALSPVPEGHAMLCGGTGLTTDDGGSVVAPARCPDTRAVQDCRKGVAEGGVGSGVVGDFAAQGVINGAVLGRGVAELSLPELAWPTDSKGDADGDGSSTATSGWPTGPAITDWQAHAQVHVGVASQQDSHASCPGIADVGADANAETAALPPTCQGEGERYAPPACAGSGGFFDQMLSADKPEPAARNELDSAHLIDTQPGAKAIVKGASGADAQIRSVAAVHAGWGVETGKFDSVPVLGDVATTGGDQKTTEAQSYWWTEWGCWVSACGQYYYDQASGTWPQIYSAADMIADGQTAQAWPPDHSEAVDAPAATAVADLANIGVAATAASEAPAKFPAGWSLFESLVPEPGQIEAAGDHKPYAETQAGLWAPEGLHHPEGVHAALWQAEDIGAVPAWGTAHVSEPKQELVSPRDLRSDGAQPGWGDTLGNVIAAGSDCARNAEYSYGEKASSFEQHGCSGLVGGGVEHALGNMAGGSTRIALHGDNVVTNWRPTDEGIAHLTAHTVCRGQALGSATAQQGVHIQQPVCFEMSSCPVLILEIIGL